MANVIAEDTSKQILRFASGRGWRNDPTQAQGRSALQDKISNTKIKALGEDRVGAEIYKCAPRTMSKLTHPLFAKQYNTTWVASQLRGGHLFACPKGSGSNQTVKGFRDVLITETNAKIMGSDLRDKTIASARKIIVNTQYGSGFNGGSPEVCQLHMKAYSDYAERMGLPFAAIFVDLASAFASIIRRLGVGVDVTDVELVKRLQSAGFDNNQCADIVGQLRQLRLWDRAVPDSPRDLGEYVFYHGTPEWYGSLRCRNHSGNIDGGYYLRRLV